jgi:hypothetical protein
MMLKWPCDSLVLPQWAEINPSLIRNYRLMKKVRYPHATCNGSLLREFRYWLATDESSLFALPPALHFPESEYIFHPPEVMKY